jgi:hypothetical protein
MGRAPQGPVDVLMNTTAGRAKQLNEFIQIHTISVKNKLSKLSIVFVYFRLWAWRWTEFSIGLPTNG